MKGSLRQRSKGSWQITVDAGRDGSGKRVRHVETVPGGKGTAQRRMHAEDGGRP